MPPHKINYSDYDNYSDRLFYQPWRKPLANKKIRVSFSKKKKINITKHNKNQFIRRKILRKKRSFISLFNIFFLNSSIYILSRIGNTSTVTGKAFWFLILIIGLIGSLSQIGQFLKSYYGYGVVVNLESIKPNKLIFPAVTVCNVNGILQQFEPCVKQMLDYHECFGLNHTDEEIIINDSNFTLPKCPYNLTKILIEKTSDKFKWMYLLVSQTIKSRIKYGHQFEHLVRRCVYNGRHCNSDDFMLSVSHLYGNCFTFNAKNEKFVSTQAGPMNGLELELDLEIDKYSSLTQTVGARVEVHDTYLEQRIDKKGIFLSPGYDNYIAVTKSVISRLPSPYKDHCKKYNLGDSPENCLDFCLHNITTSFCGCTTMKRIHRGIPHCDLTDPLILCCMAMIVTKKHSCDCPLFCEEIVYKTKLSSSFWPIRSYYEENKNKFINGNRNSTTLTYEMFRETRLRLNVYYDTLDYYIYKQSPMYQSSEIFSQVGGHMGLWLGISLIYIFELFERTFMFCRQIFKRLKVFITV